MKVPQFVYLVDGDDSPRFTQDIREAMGFDRRILAKWFGGGDFRPYAKNPEVDNMVFNSLKRLNENGSLDELFKRMSQR